jgi:hypothetical protein
MNPFEYTVNKDRVQYTSVERVIEMVLKAYKFIPRLNLSDVIEWVGDMYGLINYPGMFMHKITGQDALTPNITIERYRGSLPVDFRKILTGGVRDYDSKDVYEASTGSFTKFRYALNDTPKYQHTGNVYNIRGGYIYIEEDSATLELAYEAFPIDERGYPLVPENQKVLEYMKEYIAEKVAFNLLAANKISQYVYETVDKRRMWRAGGAHTALLNRTSEEMEAWTWSRLKLMPRFGHDTSYTYQGIKEDLALGTNLD